MQSSHHLSPVKTLTVIFALLLSLGFAAYLVFQGTGGFKSRAESPRPTNIPTRRNVNPTPKPNSKACNASLGKTCGYFPGDVGNICPNAIVKCERGLTCEKGVCIRAKTPTPKPSYRACNGTLGESCGYYPGDLGAICPKATKVCVKGLTCKKGVCVSVK